MEHKRSEYRGEKLVANCDRPGKDVLGRNSGADCPYISTVEKQVTSAGLQK